MGPLSHKERCVSVNVASQLEGSGVRASWSPLTGDQLEAVCQEAHKLADQLQSGELSRPHSEDDMTTDTTTDREEFVQDTKTKLDVLGQTVSVLSPIKRETFCVQDSPMKQLPPAVQRRLLRGTSTNAASSTRPASSASSTRHSSATTASSTRRASVSSSTRHVSATTTSSTQPASAASSTRRASVRLGTSSPVTGVKAQPRTGLRGKAALAVVLPSKPAAPTTSCSASKSRVEKTRLQPPTKVGEKFVFFTFEFTGETFSL